MGSALSVFPNRKTTNLSSELMALFMKNLYFGSLTTRAVQARRFPFRPRIGDSITV